MNRTTTKLHLSNRDRLRYFWIMNERHVASALWSGVFVTALLLIHSLLQPAEPPLRPIVQQQPAVMVIATAQPQPPLPTLTPAPTPEPVIVEVPVYQEPVTVYVEVPVAQPVYVEVYTPPTAEPIAPTLAPQQTVLLDRQQWAEDAQRQREIQDRLANEHAGGSGKMPAPDVGDIPSSGAAEWCAAAAAANAGARCVEP